MAWNPGSRNVLDSLTWGECKTLLYNYGHVSITDPFCGPKYTEPHTVPTSKTRTASSVCPFDVRSKEITL